MNNYTNSTNDDDSYDQSNDMIFIAVCVIIIILLVWLSKGNDKDHDEKVKRAKNRIAGRQLDII